MIQIGAGLSLVALLTLSSVSTQASEATLIESQATANGVEKCKAQLKLIGDYLVEGVSHGTHATWHNEAADQRMYASLTTKAYTDHDSHVSVIATPTPSGQCDATYVETYATDKTCMVMREEVYSEWTYAGTLRDETLLLKNKDGNVIVYLTGQGTNKNICLISTREVVFDE